MVIGLETVVVVTGVGLVGWFFTPYLLRGHHRQLWRISAAAGWRFNHERPGYCEARRPSFNAPVPKPATELDTFGLLDYDPALPFRLHENPTRFYDRTLEVKAKPETRRRWKAAALDYDAELSAAYHDLLSDYQRTVARLVGLLPGGRGKLTRERAEAQRRYRTRVEAAERAYRPVYDHLARRREKWLADLVRADLEYDAKHPSEPGPQRVQWPLDGISRDTPERRAQREYNQNYGRGYGSGF